MCWLPVDADGDQGVDGDYGRGVLDSEDDGAEPWSEHPPPQHESEQKQLINGFVQSDNLFKKVQLFVCRHGSEIQTRDHAMKTDRGRLITF